MKITHREKITLVIAGLVYLSTFLFDQQTLDDWALIYFIMVVAPLGFYIATDTERRNME